MKTATVCLVASALSACLAASAADAADLLVPKQFATIQSAIDAAVGGDRVLVSAGTYSEQVNLSGKDIQLIGVHGAATTSIDGGGVRTVILGNGEPATCLVQGFTIQNGYTSSEGGGVSLVNSSAAFTDCVFRNNRASASTLWGAAAWKSQYGAPSIARCTFRENVSDYAISCIYHYLGGSIAVSDCLFSDNASTHAKVINVQNEGGSITMSILGCTFRRNSNIAQSTSTDFHAPIGFHSPYGGTITGSVMHCKFECPQISPAIPASRVAPFTFSHCGYTVTLSGNSAEGFERWYLTFNCGDTVPYTDGGGNTLTPQCPPANTCADLNGDGTVNAQDLSILLAAWGSSCP
jgi:hypothetical protein